MPTAKRAAFINSVSYHQSKEGVLLATLFHQGCVAHINQKTGEIAVVMDGLKNPHGGWQSANVLMATTASGEVQMTIRSFFKT